MRNYAEDAFHQQVASYLGWVLPPPIWWTTIPAGGGGEERGRRLKREGYQAGTPDVLIICNGMSFFLELKSGKGVLSAVQKQLHPNLEAAGARVAVCRTIDHVAEALLTWGIPMRIAKPSGQRWATALARSLAEAKP